MIKLRDYQQDAINALWGYLKSKTGNPLICIPTGGGKSLVMAAVASHFFKAGKRVLCLAHLKELLDQNRNDALQMFDVEAYHASGIYSAGLGQRDKTSQIVFAGIQSIYPHGHTMPVPDVVLIDEAHRVPTSSVGRYRTLLKTLKQRNPNLRVIGVTATPWRTSSGLLTSGSERIFDSMVYDVDLVRLIKAGYLSPLVTQAGKVAYDTTGVGVSNGQFVQKQLSLRINQQIDITGQALKEVLSYADRKKGLVFCAGVEQAEFVTQFLKNAGKKAKLVTGKTPAGERDRAVTELRSGKIDILVNVSVYTTGFNCKDVDMIVLLRPMQSTGLYVQMVGRGLRTAPGKKDCLILDFGKNIDRHGPINKIRPKANVVSSTKGGQAPAKTCPKCLADVAITIMECPQCGFQFEPGQSLTGQAATQQIIDMDPDQKWTTVEKVIYREHRKSGKPPSVLVRYMAEGAPIAQEYICPEHGGFAGRSAKNWLRKRMPESEYTPSTAKELIDKQTLIQTPVAVETQMRNGYRTVVDYKWE